MNIDLSAAADHWRCVAFKKKKKKKATLTTLTLYAKFINGCLDDKAVQKFPQEGQFDVLSDTSTCFCRISRQNCPPTKNLTVLSHQKMHWLWWLFFNQTKQYLVQNFKNFKCTWKWGELHLISWLAGMFFAHVQANSCLFNSLLYYKSSSTREAIRYLQWCLTMSDNPVKWIISQTTNWSLFL